MELEKIPWYGHGTETKFHGIYQNPMELKKKSEVGRGPERLGEVL